MFDHLDDPEPYVPSPALRAGVARRARTLRRRRRVAWAVTASALLAGSVGVAVAASDRSPEPPSFAGDPEATPTTIPPPPPTTTTAPALVEIPAVVGLPLDEATAMLEASGFGLLTTEVIDLGPFDDRLGLVLAQDPPPGSRVETSMVVVLTVGRGGPGGPLVGTDPSPDGVEVMVPDVVTLLSNVAVARIQSEGLIAEVTLVDLPDGDLNIGRVITQDPPAGTTVDAGTTVTLTIGRARIDALPLAVPDVITLLSNVAVARIRSEGLIAEVTLVDLPDGDLDIGRVITQDPPAGTTVDAGTTSHPHHRPRDLTVVSDTSRPDCRRRRGV